MDQDVIDKLELRVSQLERQNRKLVWAARISAIAVIAFFILSAVEEPPVQNKIRAREIELVGMVGRTTVHLDGTQILLNGMDGKTKLRIGLSFAPKDLVKKDGKLVSTGDVDGPSEITFYGDGRKELLELSASSTPEGGTSQLWLGGDKGPLVWLAQAAKTGNGVMLLYSPDQGGLMLTIDESGKPDLIYTTKDGKQIALLPAQ
ncbi:MAG: hypothetical protein ACRD2L_21455 [Terriglobia bacterium]